MNYTKDLDNREIVIESPDELSCPVKALAMPPVKDRSNKNQSNLAIKVEPVFSDG